MMNPASSGENLDTTSTPGTSTGGQRQRQLNMDVASTVAVTVDMPLDIHPGQGAKDTPATTDARPQPRPPACTSAARRSEPSSESTLLPVRTPSETTLEPPGLEGMPNEILFHIFEYLDVYDLLSTSRTSHLLRSVSLTPLLHVYRLHRTRTILPPLLDSRPPLGDLIAKSIFLTNTSVVSRRLGRSLVCIRLSRRLAARPSAEALVERAVLPKECVPGMTPVHVSPALVQRKRAVERERIKDGLRRWIEGKWQGEVKEREEKLRRKDESRGVGRVWRLKRFWERVGRGEELVVR